MEFSKSTCSNVKIVALIIYIILCFCLEYLYRNPLFEKSLKIEKKLYENSSDFQISFFKIITNFGTQGLIIPLFAFVFLLFPLSKSYTFLSIIVLSSYFDNVLKIIYGSPRPYWVNPEIFRVCDGGFGNPSGHSFSSFSVYLSFWNTITDSDFFKKSPSGILLKILLLIFFIGLCVTIVISRIYLSVHSINQIVFGATLGIGVYFYFYHVIQVHKYNGNKLAEYITDFRYVVFHFVKYLIYFIALLLLYFFRENNEIDYDTSLQELCPHLRKYRKYNNDGFFIGLVLFFLIGAHYGTHILFIISKRLYINKENLINSWHQGGICQFFYKLILFIPFNAPLIIFQLMKKEENLPTLFIFGVIIPYVLNGIFLFCFYILSCIRCRIANENIYRIDVPVRTDGDISYSNPEKESSNNVEIEINIKQKE